MFSLIPHIKHNWAVDFFYYFINIFTNQGLIFTVLNLIRRLWFKNALTPIFEALLYLWQIAFFRILINEKTLHSAIREFDHNCVEIKLLFLLNLNLIQLLLNQLFVVSYKKFYPLISQHLKTIVLSGWKKLLPMLILAWRVEKDQQPRCWHGVIKVLFC